MTQQVINSQGAVSFTNDLNIAIEHGWTVLHIAVNSSTNWWVAVLCK